MIEFNHVLQVMLPACLSHITYNLLKGTTKSTTLSNEEAIADILFGLKKKTMKMTICL